MFSKYFYVKGYNGKLVRNLIPEDELDIEERIIGFDSKKMTLDKKFVVTDYSLKKMSQNFLNDFWDKLENKYCEWANFGKFGDIICIERDGLFFLRYDIAFIAFLDHKK